MKTRLYERSFYIHVFSYFFSPYGTLKSQLSNTLSAHMKGNGSQKASAVNKEKEWKSPMYYNKIS